MKNWGTDVIPPENRIDLSKAYKTRDGKRVINLVIKLHNDAGHEVTFPVKGSIVVREKPFKSVYAIWTLDGRICVVNKNNKRDLVEV